MSVIIVHLSDLHFGRHFDLRAWAALKQHLTSVRPKIIAVTGDLVDHPSPLHLLAAKAELTGLAESLGAELVLVPGNHDLYWSGLDSVLSPRRDWFDRIFSADTQAAQARLAKEMRAAPGFTQPYKDAVPKASRLGNALGFAGEIPSAPGIRHKLVRPRHHPRVLFALLDSNESTRWGMAAGSVAKADLQELDAELQRQHEPDLVRVALIHHHLLPIAYSHEQVVGSEQLMVLRNAGDVLSLLAEHHFDLVLHGHRHKPQFARLDFSPTNREGYSLAVAAAGSTAADSGNDERKNCFNVITVEANGRIGVRSTTYGAAHTLAPAGIDASRCREYEESVASVKRRAHVGALAHSTLHCTKRRQRFSISEAGDLEVFDRFEGRHAKSGDFVRRQPHRASVPDDGWFVDSRLFLDPASRASGYVLELEDAPAAVDPRKPAARRFSVVFPEGNSREDPIAYEIRYACGNSVNMTRWEADERARKDGSGRKLSQNWDEEWVGVDIARPTEELILELKLPDSLEAITPFLSCSKPLSYPPSYDRDGKIVLGTEFTIDPLMLRSEGGNLRYDRDEKVWKITVANPLPGYKYQMRWRTAEHDPDERVRGEVLSQRKALLASVQRRGSGTGTELDARAQRVFAELAEPLATMIGGEKHDERRHIDILTYRSGDQVLVPLFGYGSSVGLRRPSTDVIPLGRGIAGAAFQQCRSIPWAAASSASPFVLPFASDVEQPTDWQVRTMLAIPIFHRSESGRTRPHPSAAIAVVAFASSDDDSKVTQLLGEAAPPGEELHAAARTMAHAMVQAVMGELRGV